MWSKWRSLPCWWSTEMQVRYTCQLCDMCNWKRIYYAISNMEKKMFSPFLRLSFQYLIYRNKGIADKNLNEEKKRSILRFDTSNYTASFAVFQIVSSRTSTHLFRLLMWSFFCRCLKIWCKRWFQLKLTCKQKHLPWKDGEKRLALVNDEWLKI